MTSCPTRVCVSLRGRKRVSLIAIARKSWRVEMEITFRKLIWPLSVYFMGTPWGILLLLGSVIITGFIDNQLT